MMIKSLLFLGLGAIASAANVALVTFDGASQTTHNKSSKVRAAAAAAAAPASGEIQLLDFTGKNKTLMHAWRAYNDPVMGGQSYSTVAVENGVLNFTGAVIVHRKGFTSGFITAVNGPPPPDKDKTPFVDVSSCTGLKIVHKSANDYAGFRVSFGYAHPSGGTPYAYGYKAHFDASVGKFGAAEVSFKNFTDFWDGSTGAPIHTCQENAAYCPDAKTLGNMRTMSFWAESVLGTIALEIQSVSGYGCSE